MKKCISLSLLALFISASLVFAQKRETRNVNAFTKISFGFPGKLYLKQGSPQKVELEGNKDVLEKIPERLLLPCEVMMTDSMMTMVLYHNEIDLIPEKICELATKFKDMKSEKIARQMEEEQLFT